MYCQICQCPTCLCIITDKKCTAKEWIMYLIMAYLIRFVCLQIRTLSNIKKINSRAIMYSEIKNNSGINFLLFLFRMRCEIEEWLLGNNGWCILCPWWTLLSPGKVNIHSLLLQVFHFGDILLYTVGWRRSTFTMKQIPKRSDYDWSMCFQ